MTGEYLGPRLITDTQRVSEAASDCQRQPLALAFQQRVGRDSGSHPYVAKRSAFFVDDAPYSGESGVVILTGVFRQQLFDAPSSVDSGRNDVGEGSAAIDRKIPGHGHGRKEADAGPAAKPGDR